MFVAHVWSYTAQAAVWPLLVVKVNLINFVHTGGIVLGQIHGNACAKRVAYHVKAIQPGMVCCGKNLFRKKSNRQFFSVISRFSCAGIVRAYNFPICGKVLHHFGPSIFG